MKIILTLISVLITTYSMACQFHQDMARPCITQPNQYQEDLIESSYSAAQCDDDRFLKEAKEEYEKLSANQTMSQLTILGKRIRGKKDDLFYLNKMLTGKGRVPQKARQAIAECSEALCVLEKILDSKESAYRALNVAYVSSYRTALTQSTAEDYFWSKRELRDLNYAVNMMPQSLLKSQSMGNFYNLPDGFGLSDSPNASGWASPGEGKTGSITFRDHIRGNNEWGLSVMIHEMAHHHDFKGYLATNFKKTTANRIGYFKVNGWKVVGKKVETIDGYRFEEEVWGYDKENSCFPRDYASTSPEEDFAEAITYYITEGDKFKTTCPKVYGFMKDNVFAGREYKKPAFHNVISDYLKAHQDDLRHCISSKASFISYTSTQPTFSNSQMKISVADQCAKDVASIISQNIDDSGASCSMRTFPQDIEKTVSAQLASQFKDVMEKEINVILSKDNLLQLQRKCREQKDFREGCITQGMNEQYQAKGYQGVLSDSFFRVKQELPSLSYEDLKTSANDIFLKCVEGSSSNLVLLVTNPNLTGSICGQALTKSFDQEGFKYDIDFRLQLNELIQKSDNSAKLSFIKEKILKKKRSDFKGSCFIASKSCVMKGIRKKLIEDLGLTDNPEIDSFVEAVYGAFDYQI